MKTKFFNLFLLIGLSFFSCSDDTNKSVVAKGIVIDDNSKVALPKSRVLVFAWYNAKYNGKSYLKKELITDEQGKFEIKLKKNIFKIELAVIAEGYIPLKKKIIDFSDTETIELLLVKKDLVNIGEYPLANEKDVYLFSRIDFISSRQADPIFFGINFYNEKSDNNDSAHLIIQETEKNYPKILKSLNGATLFPVRNDKNFYTNPEFNKDIKLSEVYVLKGDEMGFWIKLDSDFFKLKLVEANYEKSVPTTLGYFREYGMKFKQSSLSDLKKPIDSKSFDLEKFLLEP